MIKLDQVMLAVHVDFGFVTEIILAVLLCPASIGVFLQPF